MVQGANTLVQKREKKSFADIINSEKGQALISNSFPTKEAKAAFTASLISAVGQNEALKLCEPASIISAGLHGVSMGLSLPLGQFSIIPYGSTAKYQISYKGLAQMAIRSGEYNDINVFDVRDGEYKGRDKTTRAPVFEWVEDDDLREQLPIIGYYGFFRISNGFTQTIYWTHDKILRHADRYAKAFSLEKYEKLLAGELPQSEAEKLRGGSPWYDDPNGEAHMKMCRKTILIQLLNSGFAPLSTEMVRAMEEDKASEDGDFISAEDVALGVAPKSSVEAEFEEANDEEPKAEIDENPAELPQEAQKPAPKESHVEAPKRGRPRKASANDDGFEASFFGEG